ncbi:MAG: CDP-alcohol phosphatidyltransferase family protein [Clostridia bacterium]|nr:CDP-alcohol phosphatidyltransferase family protein [Clostridia bacterium]
MSNVRDSLRENLTVPNLLSCLRLVVIVPMVKFIVNEAFIQAGLMLLISAVSDMFDGMIARKFDQVTQLGKMLDPVADKLTLIAVLSSLCFIDETVFCFAAVLFMKEFLMLSGGLVLLLIKIKPPAAKWYGKLSTVIFYTSVTVLVLIKAVWGISNAILTVVLFSVTTASMLFSLVMYTILFTGLIVKKNKMKDKYEKR